MEPAQILEKMKTLQGKAKDARKGGKAAQARTFTRGAKRFARKLAKVGRPQPQAPAAAEEESATEDETKAEE